MVSKQDTAAEFQIQQEDFPALPGAQSMCACMCVCVFFLFVCLLVCVFVICCYIFTHIKVASTLTDPNTTSIQDSTNKQVYHLLIMLLFFCVQYLSVYSSLLLFIFLFKIFATIIFIFTNINIFVSFFFNCYC